MILIMVKEKCKGCPNTKAAFHILVVPNFLKEKFGM